MTEPARLPLVRMVYGFMTSALIHAAVELGIPELVEPVPLGCDALAAATGTHAPSLRRLLRALVSLGVLDEPETDRYGLAALGEPLLPGSVDSVNAITRLFCGREFWESWANLAHSLRTGQAAFADVYGTSFFAYLDEHRAVGELFNDAMAENARFEAPRFAAGCDFGRFGTIVDVGGGNGALLHAILTVHSALKGVIFELPAAAEQARAATKSAGLGERCSVVDGDFFVEVPVGGDAYLLKSVMHNWDDDGCVAILRNCRTAMPGDGSLLLLEPVLPARMSEDTVLETVLSDLNMLTLTAGGVERTEADFRRILAEAGFRVASISETITDTDFRVIEAEP